MAYLTFSLQIIKRRIILLPLGVMAMLLTQEQKVNKNDRAQIKQTCLLVNKSSQVTFIGMIPQTSYL